MALMPPPAEPKPRSATPRKEPADSPAPPAKPRRRWGWAIFKLLAGVTLWLLAAALTFLVIEHVLSRPVAVVATLLTSLLAPAALTQLLTPALRRVDSSASFGRNLPGLMGVCAILTLVALPLSARAPVSSALSGFPTRHPHAGPLAHRVARALAAWIAPPPPPAPVQPRAHTDGGVRDVYGAALDASAARDVGLIAADVPRDLGVSEIAPTVDVAALRDVTTVPDVSADAAPDAAGAPSLRVFADVQFCDLPTHVTVGDLEGDARDEVVVQCTETVHVLAFTEGRLVERLRFSPVAPAGLTGEAGRSFVYDMDGDGRRDVLLCARYLSGRGGERGGITYYAPNRGDGRYGALVAIDHMGGCGAVAVGDITGDRQPELLIAHTGNPYLASQPNGDVTWFARTGRTWTRRGRQTVSKWPDGIFFADVNSDAIPDAVVTHGWDAGDAVAVLPGSRGGLRAADATLHAPAPPSLGSVRARFDDDDTPDEARLRAGGVVLLRSQPVETVVAGYTAASETVPPRPDAGVSADAGTDDETP
jgi:hypothetical protein